MSEYAGIRRDSPKEVSAPAYFSDYGSEISSGGTIDALLDEFDSDNETRGAQRKTLCCCSYKGHRRTRRYYSGVWGGLLAEQQMTIHTPEKGVQGFQDRHSFSGIQSSMDRDE
jgi:hypothetical protein